MRLSPRDVELFYKLTCALHCFVNRKRAIVQDIATPEALRELPFDRKVQIRDALWENPELIDSFVEENPFGLPGEELEIAGTWSHFVRGRFILISYHKK